MNNNAGFFHLPDILWRIQGGELIYGLYLN